MLTNPSGSQVCLFLFVGVFFCLSLQGRTYQHAVGPWGLERGSVFFCVILFWIDCLSRTCWREEREAASEREDRRFVFWERSAGERGRRHLAARFVQITNGQKSICVCSKNLKKRTLMLRVSYCTFSVDGQLLSDIAAIRGLAASHAQDRRSNYW